MNKWDWGRVVLAYFVTLGSIASITWGYEKIGWPAPLRSPASVVATAVGLSLIWSNKKEKP